MFEFDENTSDLDLSNSIRLTDSILFKNRGYVNLNRLLYPGKGLIFNNHGTVYLNSLVDIDNEYQFNNNGDVLFLNCVIL